jgi:phage-related protein
MSQWDIELYEKPNGRCPTKDFLDSLPADERAMAVNSIKQLRQHGTNLQRPHTGYLRDHINELRIRVRRNRYRILYFFYHAETIVLLQGFQKKTNKVPDHQIDQAVEYRLDYESTHRR